MWLMARKTSVAVLLAVVLGALACGCQGGESLPAADVPAAEDGPITVTDLANRTVVVPGQVDRVVAIGSGALRLVVYAGGADRVVGIEEFETRPPVARPYTLANPELLELPIIGTGGPDSAPDAERLLSAVPDVIFVNQIADAEGADELQSKTGIPVVVVSYGSLGTLDEPFFVSMALIGKVLGTGERAGEIISYVRGTLEDLARRTADVPDAEKASAYIGGLGFKGARGLESTQPKYLPLAAIDAANAAASVEQSSAVMIDREQIMAWDPDHIFLDLGSLSLVRGDAAVDRTFYEGLDAVSGGRVHAQLPFNNYSTNVEIALADAYFAGTVLFPEHFADVDPAAKTDEIATALVGGPVYDRLVEIYGHGFGTVDLLGGE